MSDSPEGRTKEYVPYDRKRLRAKRARHRRHKAPGPPPPAGEQIYAANIAPAGPPGSTALVAPTVAGVQAAAQAAGLNVAALMGYYDDSQNVNYVGLCPPSTDFDGYQLFAEGQDDFYGAFYGRSLTMRLAALHGLAIYGWGLGWAYPVGALPSWGSGADRTFLQVWVPQRPAVAPLNQVTLFGASYDHFVARWVNEQMQKPSRHLDLILAYTEADSDCYLGVFSPGATAFTDFLATTDWNTFVARQQANAPYALSDFKIYDRAGVRHYVGVWNGPSVAGTQSQFGEDLGSLNSFLAPLSLGSASMDTYRYLPRWAGLPWTQQIPTYIADRNVPPVDDGARLAVGLGGSIVASGAAGLARSTFEPKNPNQPFTIDSRIFLWSLTKLVATARAPLCSLDPRPQAGQTGSAVPFRHPSTDAPGLLTAARRVEGNDSRVTRLHKRAAEERRSSPIDSGRPE